MKRILPYFAVGLLGMLCGVVIGSSLGQTDHWKIVHEYRTRIEDPRFYEPAGPPGLLVSDDMPDIGPSLAALVAKGELNHVDLVFPNVPSSRDVTRYWMQKCEEIDGVVEATANHEYVEFKTSGVQPFHTNIWFKDEAEEEVKELISGIESFAKQGAQEKTSSPRGLEQSWSLVGPWTGVFGDENKNAVYALDLRGKCFELDSAGKTRREVKLPEEGSLLRPAGGPGDGGTVLLTFTVWRHGLRAYNVNGRQLWSYPRATGINDVWAVDLNNDETDEVIVGYNGGTGLHVLDSKGQLLWKSAAIGNVWHVCAGDVWGQGTQQVVTTSAAGQVHVFGGDGKNRKDFDAGCYAFMVRVGKLSPKDNAATILVVGPALGGGASQKTVILTALSGDGTKKWSLELRADAQPHVVSAYLAPGKPLLAVGMRGGQVHVVDVEKREVIASVNGQGMAPEVGWATSEDGGAPLLLVATGSNLNAFRVTRME